MPDPSRVAGRPGRGKCAMGLPPLRQGCIVVSDRAHECMAELEVAALDPDQLRLDCRRKVVLAKIE